VTPATAVDLTREYPVERIKAKIEVLDWLVGRKDQKVAKSPAGFLVKSIQKDYVPPKGFVSKEEEAQRRQAKAQETRRLEEAKRKEVEDGRARVAADSARITSFWESLSSDEKERVRAEALAVAPDYCLKSYRRHEKTDAEKAAFWWRNILANYLDTKSPSSGDNGT
jgi:hypothetical protein